MIVRACWERADLDVIDEEIIMSEAKTMVSPENPNMRPNLTGMRMNPHDSYYLYLPSTVFLSNHWSKCDTVIICIMVGIHAHKPPRQRLFWGESRGRQCGVINEL